MGSPASEEVYVALGKNLTQNVSTLEWILHSKIADSLVLLHVQHPTTTIPSPFGKIPVNKVCKSVVKAHEEDEIRKLNDCLAFYLQICSQAKVKAKASIVKKADVRSGIVETIKEQGITRLIMGTSSTAAAKSKKSKIQRTGKAGYVLRHASNSCDISVICKGKLLVVRGRTVVDNVPRHRTPDFPGELEKSRFEDSSDIQLAGRREVDRHETQLSPEERIDSGTLKFLLTEALGAAENTRGEIQREIIRRNKAEAAAMKSARKLRTMEGELKMKENCPELARRLREVEEELQVVADNGRLLSTQITKFSHERHQALQDLQAAQEKVAAMRTQNYRILKEKDEEIKRLQDLLHSTISNVEFGEHSS